MANLAAMKAGRERAKAEPAPKFDVVEMAAVPPPSRGLYAEIFEQLYKLDGTKAVRLSFASDRQASAARASLKKKAANAGCKFRANRGPEAGFVWYCWVEKPEDRPAVPAKAR